MYLAEHELRQNVLATIFTDIIKISTKCYFVYRRKIPKIKFEFSLWIISEICMKNSLQHVYHFFCTSLGATTCDDNLLNVLKTYVLIILKTLSSRKLFILKILSKINTKWKLTKLILYFSKFNENCLANLKEKYL